MVMRLFHLLLCQPIRFLAVFPELCIMETRVCPGLFTSVSLGKRPFPLFSVVYSEHGSKENALHRGREERRTEMIGAIVGDIVGSVYEWNNIKTKDFPLFREDCFFTDDTVMTCAVAEAIMEGGTRDAFIDAMKKYGRMYPDARATAAGSGRGCGRTAGSPTTALETAPPCEFPLAHGSWTAVSAPGPACGP